VALLTWNPACTVGVTAMDDQHGIVMDAMNELCQAVANGSGREVISKSLDQLIEFTRMHFSSEESLMERAGFPGLAEHRAQHQCMLARMLNSAHRLQYGNGIEMSSFLSFLRDWYVDHSSGLDQQYGPWLNDRGMS